MVVWWFLDSKLWIHGCLDQKCLQKFHSNSSLQLKNSLKKNIFYMCPSFAMFFLFGSFFLLLRCNYPFFGWHDFLTNFISIPSSDSALIMSSKNSNLSDWCWFHELLRIMYECFDSLNDVEIVLEFQILLLVMMITTIKGKVWAGEGLGRCRSLVAGTSTFSDAPVVILWLLILS